MDKILDWAAEILGISFIFMFVPSSSFSKVLQKWVSLPFFFFFSVVVVLFVRVVWVVFFPFSSQAFI